MIEGINYYPKKSKFKYRLKILVSGLVIALFGLYIYFQYDTDTVEKSAENILIVVEKSQPEAPQKIQNNPAIPNKIKPPKPDNSVKNTMVLDELIQTFEQQ